MHEKNDLIPFLKQCKLFENLSDQELQLLLPFLRTASYEKDSFVVKEEEKGDEIFLIQQGSVEILKKDREHDTLFRIATLKAGEWFGEVAVLGSNVRISSAKTLEPTETIILHQKDLDTLAEKSPSFIKILKNLAKKAAERLGTSNEMLVQSMKEELRISKTHDQMGRFIVHLFIILTFFVYTLKFFDEYGSETVITKFLGSTLIISFALSCIILVKRSHFPLEFYGLSLKNWKKNCIEAVIFTIPVLIFMVGLKWFFIQTVPEFSKLSVIQIGNPPAPHQTFLQKAFDHFFSKPQEQVHFSVILTIYTALVPVQEFIARGCLQSSLRNFFTTSNRAFLAILTSNLLFGLFHGIKSFTFALSAFILGLFWGWMYERQKTIIGPTISHILIGLWGLGVLSFQSILIY